MESCNAYKHPDRIADRISLRTWQNYGLKTTHGGVCTLFLQDKILAFGNTRSKDHNDSSKASMFNEEERCNVQPGVKTGGLLGPIQVEAFSSASA